MRIQETKINETQLEKALFDYNALTEEEQKQIYVELIKEVESYIKRYEDWD